LNSPFAARDFPPAPRPDRGRDATVVAFLQGQECLYALGLPADTPLRSATPVGSVQFFTFPPGLLVGLFRKSTDGLPRPHHPTNLFPTALMGSSANWMVFLELRCPLRLPRFSFPTPDDSPLGSAPSELGAFWKGGCPDEVNFSPPSLGLGDPPGLGFILSRTYNFFLFFTGKPGGTSSENPGPVTPPDPFCFL